MSNSAKNPLSVKDCALSFSRMIKELPPVWVEGEISQLNARPGSGVVYLTLRDLTDDYNIPLKMFTTYYKTLGVIKDNAKVLVKLRPDFWANGGRMTFHVDELHQTGIGDLFASIEALKNKLQAEGLFDQSLKKPIPFLPKKIGIICGRESDAKKDVVENAKRKWPAAKFLIKEVAVQGQNAVKEVCAAFLQLEKDPEVEVIVITRGGGSFEDLLPFSDEVMLRVIAERTKPVISAIGHEKDQPILDLIADWRASTPTDAGKKVVPDYLQENDSLRLVRARLNRFIENVLSNEMERVDYLRSRSLKSLLHQIELAKAKISALKIQVNSLSPQSILDRGYAVVLDSAGALIKSGSAVKSGESIKVRLSQDEILATVTGVAKLSKVSEVTKKRNPRSTAKEKNK